MTEGRLGRFLVKLGIARPEARAWAMYDWANSAMITTIITAVFPIYFQRVAAFDIERSVATNRYSIATTLALVIVAVMAPLLGALADVRAAKKRFLVIFAGIGIAAVTAMFFVQHGDWKLALVLFVLANVGAAGSFVFYDSLLPHVAGPNEMDRLSTTGYALGYVGGGLLLALNLAWIQWPGLFGLPSGDGLDPAQETLPYRLAFLSVAIWWGAFSIPLLRHVREPLPTREPDEAPGASGLRTSLQRLGETFRELRRYKNAFLMLLAFLIYNDGIVTIYRMATIYGSEKGFSTGFLIASILLVQFVGIPFALLFGRLATRVSPKRLIFVALAVYCGIAVLGFFMRTEVHFVALAILVATVQGGSQALSRSLFASLIPKHKSGEFFAFFAVGEKFAGILGPGLFALIGVLTGSSQKAILAVALFFVIGALLLSRVDVEAGRRVAEEADRDLL